MARKNAAPRRSRPSRPPVGWKAEQLVSRQVARQSQCWPRPRRSRHDQCHPPRPLPSTIPGMLDRGSPVHCWDSAQAWLLRAGSSVIPTEGLIPMR